MVPIRYNARSLFVRKTSTFLTAIGIGLVVFALCASKMLANGVERTLAAGGRDDVAIVLRKGSDAELGSTIEDAQVSIITSQAQVKTQAGKPVSAAEVIVVTASEKLGADGVTNLQVRGVEPDVLQFRTGVKVVEGRMPQAGADEAVIGKRIRGRFRGIELGQKFELKKKRPITVVGVFEDGGSSHESEVWVDIDVLRVAFAREGFRSAVRVVLQNTGAFDAFRASIESDKRMGLQAMRESTYYEKQSEGTAIFVNVLGTLVTVFFSIAAVIGAAITMYAAVANRAREVGILRALGFSRIAIMFSFVLESMMLSLLGGAIGVALSLTLSGFKFSMMNWASWSEMVFSLEATPSILISGILFSAFMGLFGGFLPALRASAVSPVAAMRG